MDSGDFFVMLFTQNGSYTPLMNDEEIAKFGTKAGAVACAADNPLGEAFGFVVFEIGNGE